MQHDLKNPLNVLQLYLESFTLNAAISLEDKDDVVRMFGCIDQMKSVLSGMQKLFDISQKPLTPKSFDISLLVFMAIDNCISQDRTRKCVYSIEKANIKADKELLQMAIFNLVENTWKYSSHKKITEMHFGYFTNDNNDPVFYLKDNGSGFDPQKSELIFEPFKRAHKNIDGSGIGLAIVNKIITVHGGKVWATCKPNEGATFFFTLPQQHFEAQSEEKVIITNGGNDHEKYAKEIPHLWSILQLDQQSATSS